MSLGDIPFYQDRRVWILGASSGIGRALSVELASRGAEVIASARNAEALDNLVDSFNSPSADSSGAIEALPMDVTEPGVLASAIEMMQNASRLPDSVVFMAAFYHPSSIHKIRPEDLERTLRVNLWAALELVRVVAPLFYARGTGQIALVGSVAGYRGLPKGQPYSATKAGLINLAETLYLEARPKGIDIKLINPGFVETAMTEKNEFDMPDIVSSEVAAKQIARGLTDSAFEIHFPKRFTRKLKFLRWLPYKLYFYLTGKL